MCFVVWLLYLHTSIEGCGGLFLWWEPCVCMLSGLGGGGWWVLKLCQGVTGASVCLWVKGRRGDKVVRILCLTKISLLCQYTNNFIIPSDLLFFFQIWTQWSTVLQFYRKLYFKSDSTEGQSQTLCSHSFSVCVIDTPLTPLHSRGVSGFRCLIYNTSSCGSLLHCTAAGNSEADHFFTLLSADLNPKESHYYCLRALILEGISVFFATSLFFSPFTSSWSHMFLSPARADVFFNNMHAQIRSYKKTPHSKMCEPSGVM